MRGPQIPGDATREKNQNVLKTLQTCGFLSEWKSGKASAKPLAIN